MAGNHVVLKSFDEPFTYDVGDLLLQHFSFNQGSAPMTGLRGITEKVWPDPEKEVGTHRVCLMLTDGFSRYIDREKFI